MEKTWNLTLQAWKEVEVEAKTKEEAIQKAYDEVNAMDWDGCEVVDNMVTNLETGEVFYVKDSN
ncbi:MAG: hypothetical protein IKP66_09235 [Lachnospiraceae bacterium]|nr:hypothetical protein [Lachnospiraceae bacterium]